MSKLSIILLLAFVLSFLLKVDYSFDQDLGRHIKLGEIILKTQLPLTNLFSYTYPDFPFINTHWFFEVLVYALNNLFGIQYLFWLKIVILITTYYLTLIITKKTNWLLLPIGFLFFHILRERTDFRPELFSFLFTALTVFILEKHRQNRTKLLYILPIIQLLWVNTHIYFLIGLIIQTFFIASSLTFKYNHNLKSLILNHKSVLLILVLSLFATLLNPNFAKGALYPMQVFGNYGYSIAENQNIFLLESLNFADPNFLFVKIVVLLIFISFIYGLISRTLNLLNLSLTTLGVILALLNIRSFPYLILLSLPFVLQILNPLNEKKWLRPLNFFVVGVLLIESFLYSNNSYYLHTDSQTKFGTGFSENYKKGLDFVKDNSLSDPIFNNFDMGSYISYRFYNISYMPRHSHQVFVDGRPEAYPADFFQKIYIPMQEKPEVFKDQSEKYGFKTIIFSITDQTPWAAAFFASITKNPDWNIVYLDNYMIILVDKQSVIQKKLQVIDLNSITAEYISSTDNMTYLRLAHFLYNTGYLKQSYQFAQKSLSIFPNSPGANKLILALQTTRDNFGISNSGQYYHRSSNLFFW